METFRTVGFVGGGRVTRFLIEGWQAAAALPERIPVFDVNHDIVAALMRDFPPVLEERLEGVASADLLVLAVHPPVLREVMGTLRRTVRRDTPVLSLAPKITAAAIADALGVDQVVRMIPNAPSALGVGYNPVAYHGVDHQTRAALERLFAPWGRCPEVPERELEAYAMISAMGPTYLWFQLQTLRDLARDFGLGLEQADEAILAMVEGAARCLLATGREPSQVMDMVPVRPLKDAEETIVAAYRTHLPVLYAKIRP